MSCLGCLHHCIGQFQSLFETLRAMSLHSRPLFAFEHVASENVAL